MEQLRPGDPSRIGNYRLIGRLGEGGMGQVFLGLSPGGRQVAVKIIHPGHASGRQFRERFTREIEAARRVGGYYTASVVDADPTADPPWMVTAFIPGPSLQQAVIGGGPFSLEGVCRLGAALAEGLAAIHACGLVHRDLKPSNVILADDGPRIIDFGIARAAEASPMTTAGMVVGTYSYMSPEQLRGEVAGPASDVFALGCTLAFAATARVTFGDDSIVTVVYRITTEPPDLRGVTEAHGFRQLIGECLDKNPAARPGLAAILERLAETGSAAALRSAAEPGPAGRATGGDGGIDSRAASAPPMPYEPPAAHEAPRPYEAPAAYEAPRPYEAPAAHEAPRPYEAPAAYQPSVPSVPYEAPRPYEPPVPYESSMLYEPTRTMHTGDRTGPGQETDPRAGGPQPTTQDRPPAWDIGQAAERGGRGSAGGPSGAGGSGRGRRRTVLIAATAVVVVVGAVLGVVLSSGPGPKPPNHAVGTPSPHRTAHPSPGPPSQPEAAVHDPGGKDVFGVAFSSGTVMATADSNGKAYLWNLTTGKLAATLHDPNSNGINGIAYNSNSNTFVTADASGDVYLWNASTDKLTATLNNVSHKGNDSVAISPDGGFVAVGDADGNSSVWSVAGGTVSSTPTLLHDPGGKHVYGVAFSPNGSYLAAGDTNGTAYLWDLATGKLAASFKDPNSKGLYDVAFSPDGSLLAVTDDDGSNGLGVVYLWDIATGKLTATLQSFDNGEYADLAFSPNGRYIAVADTDGSLELFDVATDKVLARLAGTSGQNLIAVSFSPDGQAVATTDIAGNAYVWSTKWLGS
jgi:DNA-binding beta-propeller fold protein YncE